MDITPDVHECIGEILTIVTVTLTLRRRTTVELFAMIQHVMMHSTLNSSSTNEPYLNM